MGSGWIGKHGSRKGSVLSAATAGGPRVGPSTRDGRKRRARDERRGMRGNSLRSDRCSHMVPGRLGRTGAGKGRAYRGMGEHGTRARCGAPLSVERGGRPDQGPSCRAKQVHPRANPILACREAAMPMQEGDKPRRRQGGVRGRNTCRPPTVLMRRQGALCPARTTADRKIAPDASFVLRGAERSICRGFSWGRAGGADGPLSRDRRHSIGVSEPDVPPGQQRREDGEDFAFLTAIWVSRPLPPAKWILGLFRLLLFSKAWAASPILRRAALASSRKIDRTASAFEIAGKSELDPAAGEGTQGAGTISVQTCQVVTLPQHECRGLAVCVSPARVTRPQRL